MSSRIKNLEPQILIAPHQTQDIGSALVNVESEDQHRPKSEVSPNIEKSAATYMFATREDVKKKNRTRSHLDVYTTGCMALGGRSDTRRH